MVIAVVLTVVGVQAELVAFHVRTCPLALLEVLTLLRLSRGSCKLLLVPVRLLMLFK